MKKRVELAKVNALKVVANYKKLVALKDEVTEPFTITYEYGFNDYNAKVAKLLSNIDLSKVIIEEATKDGEVQDENANEVPAKGVTYLAPKVTLTKEAVCPTPKEVT